MKNNMLSYKGYHARPEYSAADELFYGVILGISDLVDFSAENAKDIKKEFEKAVDDYIAFCDEIGVEPQKEYSGTFNVRVPPELHKKASIMAASQNITMNKFVEIALQSAVDNLSVPAAPAVEMTPSIPQQANQSFTTCSWDISQIQKIFTQGGENIAERAF